MSRYTAGLLAAAAIAEKEANRLTKAAEKADSEMRYGVSEAIEGEANVAARIAEKIIAVAAQHDRK